ncbi:YkgJ family cysteine cluster protein [Bacteroidota bacterium]
MICRENCGACCSAPSISSPIPGMPDGKPSGVPCVHLQEDFSCGIYDQRPQVCRDFQAEELVCGSTRQEALDILGGLEA